MVGFAALSLFCC
uniref:Uncharacterized protein n=1 Tax=Arundo donax TaxID=35708 RepID=A0A0A9A620_ARUDO